MLPIGSKWRIVAPFTTHKPRFMGYGPGYSHEAIVEILEPPPGSIANGAVFVRAVHGHRPAVWVNPQRLVPEEDRPQEG